MRIVIVEDEVRIRDGLRYLLSKMGSQYRVVAEACTGREGLQKVLETQPDLVITDVRMEDMNGLEMLERIEKSHIETKSIILSAYSEFAYAQQAVRLGVCDYLLKPVNAGDFISTIQHMETLVEQAYDSQNPRELEGIAEDLLAGRIQWNETLAQSLSERYGVSQQTKLLIVAAYMGNDNGQFTAIRKILKEERKRRQPINGLLIRWEAEKTLFLAFYGNDLTEKGGMTVCQGLFRNRDLLARCSVGYIYCEGFRSLPEKCTLLRNVMDWSITFGDHSVIDYRKVKRVKPARRPYPSAHEKALRSALCARDHGNIEKAVMAFFNALWPDSENTCSPDQAKEFTASLLWFMINTSKELGLLEMPVMKQHALFEQVKWARTRSELVAIAMKISGEMLFWRAENLHENALITRTIELIRSYYREGITQEEIAMKLGVTQEYLSTAFHKNVGISFSRYLRDLRIQKAKEMLIGTNLKQNEIARRIGYTDAKYFSKVFKECTGMLPTDYRRRNR